MVSCLFIFCIFLLCWASVCVFVCVHYIYCDFVYMTSDDSEREKGVKRGALLNIYTERHGQRKTVRKRRKRGFFFDFMVFICFCSLFCGSWEGFKFVCLFCFGGLQFSFLFRYFTFSECGSLFRYMYVCFLFESMNDDEIQFVYFSSLHCLQIGVKFIVLFKDFVFAFRGKK